jgi:hypothetical protein
MSDFPQFPAPVLLKEGDIAKTPIIHNIYSGDRKSYAIPFEHTIWTDLGDHFGEKKLGVAIRIHNSETKENDETFPMIIGNRHYTGHAITCFLDEKYLGKVICSVKITKVNKHSVIGEPIEWYEDLTDIR